MKGAADVVIFPVAHATIPTRHGCERSGDDVPKQERSQIATLGPA